MDRSSGHRLRDEGQQLRVEVDTGLERANVVGGEHALDTTLDGRLGDDVDGRGLDLDEERLRVDCLQLLLQRRAVGEVRRDMDDIGLEVVDRRRPGREDRDPPPASGVTGRRRSSTGITGTSFSSRIGAGSPPPISRTRSETSTR